MTTLYHRGVRHGSLTRYTAPADLPVSLAEVKAHLKIESETTTDDIYLADILIPAAVEDAERYLGRALITQTWDWSLDHFPSSPFEVPKPPLISVTHIKYQDENDVQQTWASTEYVVDAPAGPAAPFGRIALANNCGYPSTFDEIKAITIRFVCGYGAVPSTVPGMVRAGILLRLTDLYVNRDGLMPSLSPVVQNCWRPYRAW